MPKEIQTNSREASSFLYNYFSKNFLFVKRKGLLFKRKGTATFSIPCFLRNTKGMHACLSIYASICVHTYLLVNTYTYTHTHCVTYGYIWLYAYMYVYSVWMHVFIHLSIYQHRHCVCVCVNVHKVAAD